MGPGSAPSISSDGNIGVVTLMLAGASGALWLVVVLFTKAVQFMNFPKRLSAIFIGSTAALCALDKHSCLESRILPLNTSVAIMRTMDTIREQWGLVYPMEKGE